MAEQETRRSVMPNGKKIDEIRKRIPWSIEALALNSDLGMRTVQKAIAGSPVSFETLQIIAETLKVPYESLLLGADVPEMLTLNLNLKFEVGAADTKKIKDIIAILQKLLPDNSGLCVIAVASGSVVIGVAKSQANENVLAGLELQEAMNTFCIESWSLKRKRETMIFGFLESGHTWIYLSYARQMYDLHEHGKPWDELSKYQEYDYYAKYLRLIADKYWTDDKKGFQGLLDRIKLDVRLDNYEALYNWCQDYRMNKILIEYQGRSSTEQFSLVSAFIRYINCLDGAHKYELLRDQISNKRL